MIIESLGLCYHLHCFKVRLGTTLCAGESTAQSQLGVSTKAMHACLTFHKTFINILTVRESMQTFDLKVHKLKAKWCKSWQREVKTEIAGNV